jgi:hypothetical protein
MHRLGLDKVWASLHALSANPAAWHSGRQQQPAAAAASELEVWELRQRLADTQARCKELKAASAQREGVAARYRCQADEVEQALALLRFRWVVRGHRAFSLPCVCSAGVASAAPPMWAGAL